MPLRLSAALAALVISSNPAFGAISILGGGFAQSCYQAAEFKRPLKTGLLDCNAALNEEVLAPRDRAATFVNRGILYMFERNFPEAIKDYDNALKLNDRLAEAYVNKGIAVLHQGGNAMLAIDLLSKGLDLDPARPEVAYYSRAVAHEKSGNTKEAYYDYQQAAALKPEWEDPRRELTRFKVIAQ